MDYKKIILEIIRDNQSLGVHKIDRLFHMNVDFSISWIPIMKKLEEEGLIEKNEYKITQKGLDYLNQHP